LLGPVFAWVLSKTSGDISQLEHKNYQVAFLPFLLGVAIAILLTFKLIETGTAVRKTDQKT